MGAGGNLGRSWVHWKWRSRTSSSQRTTGTGKNYPDCSGGSHCSMFPPMSPSFLWSPPFPSPHTACRATGFYVHSTLHVGTEPGAAGRSHQHLGLCTFLALGKLQGMLMVSTRSLTTPPVPTPGRTGQTLAALEQNEEEANTDLFCL